MFVTCQYYGIPQHYGLFYAMGTALMVLIFVCCLFSLLTIYLVFIFHKVEGVLSACYHICPTHANYQFGKVSDLLYAKTCLVIINSYCICVFLFEDTTFKYVISMLCMLKIYQTRHPDINPEARAAFSVLAFVVLIGVIPAF